MCVITSDEDISILTKKKERGGNGGRPDSREKERGADSLLPPRLIFLRLLWETGRRFTPPLNGP